MEQAAHPTRRPVSGILVLTLIFCTGKIRLDISVAMCMERYLLNPTPQFVNFPQASFLWHPWTMICYLLRNQFARADQKEA